MSNVGRKDREAARALLGFTAMALGVSERLRLEYAQCSTQITAAGTVGAGLLAGSDSMRIS
jgi:hypothetical protein